jgi:flavin reductase (DIM6/NTAB) family NADH-FMN oxidoreductase RutF
VNRAALQELFARLDRELWLVTARDGDRRGGLIATHVTRASLPADLPRVLVGIGKRHHTWGLIEASGAFALHLLGPDNLDWVAPFGMTSGSDGDKFAGRAPTAAVTGSPVLDGALGWVDCAVEARLDTGDRTFYLGRVVESRVGGDGPPLTFKELLRRWPAEQVAELKRQSDDDGHADAEAIRRWRRQHGIDPGHDP